MPQGPIKDILGHIIIMYLYYAFVYLKTKVVKKVIFIYKYSLLLQFASPGFYRKRAAPRRWVAPTAGEDSDMEVEVDDSDMDDDDALDPDYAPDAEEGMTHTALGKNKINLYLPKPRNQDAILV